MECKRTFQGFNLFKELIKKSYNFSSVSKSPYLYHFIAFFIKNIKCMAVTAFHSILKSGALKNIKS